MLVIPSSLSALPCGPTLCLYDGREQLVAAISATSTDAVVLRFDVGARVVARGDLLDPRWRSWLATDVRCCYSSRQSDRIALLRFLTDVATLWDSHTSTWGGAA